MPGERLRLSAVQQEPDLFDLFEILRKRVHQGVQGQELFPRRRLHVLLRRKREINIRRAGSIEIERSELQLCEYRRLDRTLVREQGKECLPRLRLRVRPPLDRGWL